MDRETLLIKTAERGLKVAYFEYIDSYLRYRKRKKVLDMESYYSCFYTIEGGLIVLPKEVFKTITEKHSALWKEIFEKHEPIRNYLDRKIIEKLTEYPLEAFIVFWEKVLEFLKNRKLSEIPDYIDPYLFWGVVIRLTENLWLKGKEAFPSEVISKALQEFGKMGGSSLRFPTTTIGHWILYEFEKFIFAPEYLTTEESFTVVAKALIRAKFELASGPFTYNGPSVSEWLLNADPKIKIRDPEVIEWLDYMLDKETPEEVIESYLKRKESLKQGDQKWK